MAISLTQNYFWFVAIYFLLRIRLLDANSLKTQYHTKETQNADVFR